MAKKTDKEGKFLMARTQVSREIPNIHGVNRADKGDKGGGGKFLMERRTISAPLKKPSGKR